MGQGIEEGRGGFVEEEGKIEDESTGSSKDEEDGSGVGQFGDGLVEKLEEDWPT